MLQVIDKIKFTFFLILYIALFSCKVQDKSQKTLPKDCSTYFSSESYCERIEIFEVLYNNGINTDCLSKIIIDLSEKTLIDANIKLSYFGATYSSIDDFKADIKKWKTKLRCN